MALPLLFPFVPLDPGHPHRPHLVGLGLLHVCKCKSPLVLCTVVKNGGAYAGVLTFPQQKKGDAMEGLRCGFLKNSLFWSLMPKRDLHAFYGYVEALPATAHN